MKFLLPMTAIAILSACGGGTTASLDPEPPASEVVMDPTPTVITDISAIDMTELKAGEGIELAMTDGAFGAVKGSTITKMGEIDGQDVFLVNLIKGDNTQTEIILSADLNAYLADVNEFDARDTQEMTALISQGTIAGTSHVYGVNKFLYDGTREDLFMYLNSDDGENVLIGGYTSYRADSVETSRQYTVVNLDNEFTAPTGTVELKGFGVLGKPGATLADNEGILVGGDATMTVNFDTLTGTVEVPSMANGNENGATGEMSSQFTVNASVGTFSGSTTATLNDETGSGPMIGSFNGDGTLAMGVSNLNDDEMTAIFSVAQ